MSPLALPERTDWQSVVFPLITFAHNFVFCSLVKVSLCSKDYIDLKSLISEILLSEVECPFSLPNMLSPSLSVFIFLRLSCLLSWIVLESYLL